MTEELLNSLFLDNSATDIDVKKLLFSLIITLILGIFYANVYKYKTLYTRQFVVSLAILPTLISIIIFLVNGKLGASVAVAGTFSLIRFRSAQGGAKEITAIFMATAIGIATGMGHIYFAILFTLLISLISILFEIFDFGKVRHNRRVITLSVSQDFNYEVMLETVISNTCKNIELNSIKTSKKEIKLEYIVDLKNTSNDKELIRDILKYDPNIDIQITKTAGKQKVL